MNKRRKTRIIEPYLPLTFILVLALCAATATATVTIPADTSIGIWDEASRTYTLTTDVNQTILVGKSNLTLDGNGFTVTGSGSGVQIWGSKTDVKTDVNVMNLNITGFASGINTRFCQRITILNNNITNSSTRGITFGDETNNSTVSGNFISQSAIDAIYLNDSKNNVFTENTIANNVRGLYLCDWSNDNLFYHNNFICNDTQVYTINSYRNIFNLEYPIGGNHWSDWGGPDEDGDGFVDEPYVFSGGQDDLPFVVESGWANKPPVADAGDDQLIIEIGTLVQLDSNSYDPEGDPLIYSWSFIQKPQASLAELSDPNTEDPNFVADVHGDYILELMVSDGIGSDSDDVTITFENVKPTADAGENQSVIVNDTVVLDGSASYDGNYDLLTYSWTLISTPQGSEAQLSEANSVQTSFITDLPGEYVISLVVNDGFEDSEPANVSIMAVTNQDMATEILFEAMEQINLLGPENLKNKNMKKPLTKKINTVLAMIDNGFYVDAMNKLENDILKKMNGCADNGSPDKNDWITTCEGQNAVYPLIVDAIQYLQNIVE